MSLAELYNERFGAPEAEAVAEANGMTKEAADVALEKAIEAMSEEDAEKVAQVVSVFESEGLEFDHDLYKLASAAQIVDEYSEYETQEKTAADEIEAAGRLMARAMADELAKMAANGEEEVKEVEETEETEETEEAAEEAPQTLSEKLAAAVEKE